MNNYNKPFVSTPLTPDSELMPMNPVAMEPYMDSMMHTDMLENEYPEIYYEIYPLISEAAGKIVSSGYAPTNEMIGSMVDSIIKSSGMWYEDDDDDMEEAIPVQFGFGSSPYRRSRRRHHSRNTLRDIVRILLLRELFDRGHRQSYPELYY